MTHVLKRTCTFTASAETIHNDREIPEFLNKISKCLRIYLISDEQETLHTSSSKHHNPYNHENVCPFFSTIWKFIERSLCAEQHNLYVWISSSTFVLMILTKFSPADICKSPVHTVRTCTLLCHKKSVNLSITIQLQHIIYHTSYLV